MKTLGAAILVCFLSIYSSAPLACGQSTPAQTASPVYTGFQMPKANGTLTYALSAGGRQQFGGYGPGTGVISYGTVSGNLGLITASVTKPTTVSYTGGYLATTASQPSSFFHDFSIAQTFDTRKWQFTASDQVEYLPDSPASGLSGVFGVGTSTGVIAPQGALLQAVPSVGNSSAGDFTFKLTGKTSLDATAMYTIQRFPGYVGGIQTNDLNLGGGVTHRIDALRTAGVNYNYSTFSYLFINGSFSSQGVTALYKRQINRRLLVSVAGGPQYISASSITNRPGQYTYNADVSAAYTGNLQHGLIIVAAYQRLTTGGSGITYGATTDTFTGTVSGQITRSLSVSALGTYASGSGLQLITNSQVNIQSAIGSVQVNRALTRTLSIFVSYTALNQTYQGTILGVLPQNGLQQVLGYGITYSPSAVHLGR